MDAKVQTTPQTLPQGRVFISYSRKDMAFVDRLEEALKMRNFEPIIDRAEIYAFEDWWKRIEALIERADTIIFVLSPHAVASEVALREVAHAASLNKRFAPIVCRPVDDAAVPEPLRRLNFVFFDHDAGFETNVDRLAEALQTDLGWIRRHTEFGESARRWATSGRPSGLLLRPPVLEEAEYWIAYRPHGAPPPTDEIRTFITESRKAELVATGRRRFAQAAIHTLLVAIIVGLVGWINQDFIEAQIKAYFVIRPYMLTKVRPYVLNAAAERALKPGDAFTECAAECPQMIVVPAGQFLMGSPLDEPGHNAAEEPRHLVTIARPFAVGKFELTFAEWDVCAKYGECDPNISDSGRGRGKQPVINVDWDDAQRYVAWLSWMTGKTYRLLSEAEWEYAARGGTQTEFAWGNELGENNANCKGCGSAWDGKQAAPVGSFASNRFGIYDMEGNVWEQVEDCVHPNYHGAPDDGSAWRAANCKTHVMRGGSWLGPAPAIRNANRVRNAAPTKGTATGFRVARTLNQ